MKEILELILFFAWSGAMTWIGYVVGYDHGLQDADQQHAELTNERY